MLYQEKSVYN